MLVITRPGVPGPPQLQLLALIPHALVSTGFMTHAPQTLN